MNAHEFATHITGVRRSGHGFVGRCPGHEDQHASLSFRDGDKGVLAKCHAGCAVETITAALGLGVSDLFADTNHQPPSPPAKQIMSARYPYHDENGTLLYESVRYIPKDFRPRQPDGKGGWIWSLTDPPVRRVLYRLPHLKGQATVYVVEGEKDVDRLVALGIPATTNTGGANAWRDDYGDQLTAAGIQRVVILPDHDPAGEGYAVEVATTCLNRGLQVKIVRLPGLADKGDASDWLDAGHPLSELADLVRAAPLATPDTLEAPTIQPYRGVLVTQDGDGYRCVWEQERVGIKLTHLKEHRGGLHAEASVYRLSALGEWSDRLQWASLNLSSVTARGGLAKTLSATAKGRGVDWASLLDAASVAVAEAVRAPAPVIDLSTVEPSRHERFAVDPLISLHETNILYGDGDSGKSYLALALGIAVAGQPGNVLALPSPCRTAINGPVLYLDYETCADEVTSRLHALALGGNLYPLPSIHYRAAHRPLPEDVSHLKADIQRLGIQLLIVDSMAPACGGKPEDAETALTFMNALRSLGAVTRLVICHVSKGDVEKKRAKIFGCYADDTEVLTPQGWITHDQWRDGPILTFDPQAEQFLWQTPTATHAYEYHGDMVGLQGRTTDWLVTPNHRMLIKPKWAKGKNGKPLTFHRSDSFPRTWRFETADSLATLSKSVMPYMSHPTMPLCDVEQTRISVAGQSYSTADFLQFLGWWISEGSITGGGPEVSLAQTKGPLADRMKALAEHLGFSVRVNTNTHRLQYPSRAHEKPMCYMGLRKSKALAEWLIDHCGRRCHEKRLPPVVWSCGEQDRRGLLEALIDGDGTRRKDGSSRYCTASKRLADDVQRLAFTLEIPATISSYPPAKPHHHPRYAVNLSNRRKPTVSFGQYAVLKRVPYDGMVYCFTVPSGAYVTRRNGKIAVHGNSTFIRNMARLCWEARASRAGDVLTMGLFADKFNRGVRPKPFGLTFTWQDQKCLMATGSVIDNPELSQSADPYDRIVDALKAGPLTLSALSQDLDMPFHVLKKRLETMPTTRQIGGSGRTAMWSLLSQRDYTG